MVGKSDYAVAGTRGFSVGVEWVEGRLERAGMTFMALGMRKVGPAEMIGYWPDMVQEVWKDVPKDFQIRPPIPSAREITLMDEVFAWIPLIPQGNYIYRRVINYRIMILPLTERHLYSWKRIGKKLGCDPRTVSGWYDRGLGLIARELTTRPILMEKSLSPFNNV